jgi:ribosomal protein L32
MSNCLNCNKSVIENFCSNCGQKTSTHRITFKHFFFHDFLHGVMHLEKGILFTIKEALVRPGKAALDYISGKRIKYYNVFYLTLLLIGLNIFMNHLQSELDHKYFQTNLIPETDEAGKRMDDFFTNYSKIIIFSFIPLLAINSFILFKDKMLNLSEHFIISGMMFLGVMIISTVRNLLYFTEYLQYVDFIATSIHTITPFVILLYFIVNYYKTFSSDYNSKFELISRMSLFIVFLLLEVMFLLVLLLGYFSNWSFQMNYVT